MSTVDVDALAEFTTPAFRSNPWPFLRTLRDEHPVHRSRPGFYLVSRYADVLWVLQNTGGILRSPDQEYWTERMPDSLRHRSVRLLINSLPALNPPVHTRLRRLVARDFTPRRVERLRATIAEITDRVLDRLEPRLRAGQTVDLHADFSKPVTLNMFGELLGVPEADRAEIDDNLFEITTGLIVRTEEMLTRSDTYSERLEDYFRKLIAQRRKTPGADLLSALAREHAADPDRLTDDELIAMLWILWLAGFENSAAAMDHGARVLIEHPDQSGWLTAGHAEALAFVDEVLRYRGPLVFVATPRIATREVTLAGITLPEGTELRVVTAAANRDPAVFADPDRFDPGRDNSASVALSHGIHHCLGAFFARTELAVALSRLHTRFPSLVLAGEPAWRDEPNAYMMRDLPVALG
jgi:cytochrome P450 family 114